MTDPTPPHDAEYREQRKFEALVAAAPNVLLDNMARGLTSERLAEWQIAIVNDELDRRGKL